MRDDRTPLIRRSEKRNASVWFYGVGAALTLLTLLGLLLFQPGADPAASLSDAPPEAAVTTAD